ncbi:hypothetical protein CQ010_01575 [Arthrobacter sp. MYb211]|uniref:glycerophosphodiester phosphodiesterase n=1 Tax=unclassified Arthrobacter TaxID=235627 RepID=UPI000CFBBD56|nr:MULTISPECIES: glycerophosphodiester phosphodiesterase [unclassified Arthrobacter]PRA13364.1 hypothetical protein CQ015_03830 [Arthrobacter sp. MYb221]PRC10561.1 hypothetical protein CQ010_01575 [Arthrobacter sp. MYb211]
MLAGSTTGIAAIPPLNITTPHDADSGDLGLLSFTGQTGFPPTTPIGWTLIHTETYNANMSTWLWKRTMIFEEGGTNVMIETPGSGQKCAASIVVLSGDFADVTNIVGSSGSNDSPAVPATGDNVIMSFWAQRGGTPNSSLLPPAGLDSWSYGFGSGGGQVSSGVGGNLTPHTGSFSAGTWTTDQVNAATIVINVTVEALADSGEPEPPPPPVAEDPSYYRLSVFGESKATSITPTNARIPYTAKSGDLAYFTFTGVTTNPVEMEGWDLIWTEVFSETMTTWLWSRTLDVNDPGRLLSVVPDGPAQKAAMNMIVIRGTMDAPPTLTVNTGTDRTPGVTTTEPSITLSIWTQRGGTPNVVLEPPSGLTLQGVALGSGGGQVSAAWATDLVPKTGYVGDVEWGTEQTNAGTIVFTITLPAQYVGPPGDDVPRLSVWRGETEIPLTPYLWRGDVEIPLSVQGRPYRDPNPGMVDALEYPIIAAHRGGGDEGPENTMTAFNLVMPGLPKAVIECDLNLNGSNSLVITHDTDINGELISGMLDSRWAQMTQAWPIWSSNPPVPRSWWQELASTWGKKRVLMPEMKGTNDLIADSLIADVLARSLRRDVILQSFNFAYCAQAASVGIEACHLTNTPNFPALMAAGIRQIGVSKSNITPSIVEQAHLSGLRVWVYTINTIAERDSMLSMGVDALFSDKPTLIRLH